MARIARPAAQPLIEGMLREAQDRLDFLNAELPIRSAVHFDQLEEEARAIANLIRDAFRRGVR